MKIDVYNHVQTKYERFSPFSNPKSEKEGIACPRPPWERKKVRGVQTKKIIIKKKFLATVQICRLENIEHKKYETSFL